MTAPGALQIAGSHQPSPKHARTKRGYTNQAGLLDPLRYFQHLTPADLARRNRVERLDLIDLRERGERGDCGQELLTR